MQEVHLLKINAPEISLPTELRTWCSGMIGYVRFMDITRDLHVALFPDYPKQIDAGDPYEISTDDSLFRLVKSHRSIFGIVETNAGMFTCFDAGYLGTNTEGLRIATELPFGFDVQGVYTASPVYRDDLYQARARTALVFSPIFKRPVTVKAPDSSFGTFNVKYTESSTNFL